MFDKKEFECFETKIIAFYQKLEELLFNNERVSINIIQFEMNCGFNMAVKIKNKLIELGFVDSNGNVLIKKQSLHK